MTWASECGINRFTDCLFSVLPGKMHRPKATPGNRLEETAGYQLGHRPENGLPGSLAEYLVTFLGGLQACL